MSVCLCVSVSVYVNVCLHVCVYVCLCVFMCVYVCLCVFMYVCVCRFRAASICRYFIFILFFKSTSFIMPSSLCLGTLLFASVSADQISLMQDVWKSSKSALMGRAQGHAPQSADDCLCDEARARITDQEPLSAAITEIYEVVFCEHHHGRSGVHHC